MEQISQPLGLHGAGEAQYQQRKGQPQGGYAQIADQCRDKTVTPAARLHQQHGGRQEEQDGQNGAYNTDSAVWPGNKTQPGADNKHTAPEGIERLCGHGDAPLREDNCSLSG